MTQFLRDILRQPAELRRCVERLAGSDRPRLEELARAVRTADHVYLTGIGSSWHAAMDIASLFHRQGFPVILQDAAELLHFTQIARNSVILTLSRSGRSAEIVGLLSKARGQNASVLGLTNSAEGTLAKGSEISLCVPVALDHGISVNTYSSLALAGGVLAASVDRTFDSGLESGLLRSLSNTEAAISIWREQLENTRWLEPSATYYFMGRGPSLGTSLEAGLLWEEGVKSAATAMGTGAFRHGPQEMVASGARFGIWLDSVSMREQDLAVARDLQRLGASVMLVGHDLPRDAADLVCEVPETPPGWQFLCDIIPAQLAAERLARISGVDCDSFRFCSYIIEDEHGLLAEEKTAAPGDGK